MPFESTGIIHIGLRVSDKARAVAFYEGVLGFTKLRETDTLAIFNAYGTIIAVQGGAPQTEGDRFDPFRVGLDHLALGINDPAALAAMKEQLDAAGVPNNGVQTDDALGGTPYISFYDPDGIAWEFYTNRQR